MCLLIFHVHGHDPNSSCDCLHTCPSSIPVPSCNLGIIRRPVPSDLCKQVAAASPQSEPQRSCRHPHAAEIPAGRASFFPPHPRTFVLLTLQPLLPSSTFHRVVLTLELPPLRPIPHCMGTTCLLVCLSTWAYSSSIFFVTHTSPARIFPGAGHHPAWVGSLERALGRQAARATDAGMEDGFLVKLNPLALGL